MVLEPGRIIAGRYEIIEKIGSGGMSIVYKARDAKLERFVTFKVLREEYLNNRDFKERFKTEAKAVACLSHINIVNVYDVGQEDTVHYIVMEYIDGVTLNDILVKRGYFDNTEALGVALQIAAALSHAHKNGVIHRDIKPQNVLVTKTGAIKVMDFGIARSLSQRVDGESSMGSVHYISPEQAKTGDCDARSDLYSLGILMYEMLTGSLPFDGENPDDIAYMHVNEAFPDMAGENPEVWASVQYIVAKLTNKMPLRRYQNADALMEDLRLALAEPGGDADMFLPHGTTPPPAFEPPGNYRDKGAPGLFRKEKGNGYNERGGIEGYDDLEEETPPYQDKKVAKRKKTEGSPYEKYVMAAAAVAAVILAAIAFRFLFPNWMSQSQSLVDVPNLIGMTMEQALEKTRELGLSLQEYDQRYSDEYDAGLIIFQNYEPADSATGKINQINKGVILEVVVSLGTDKTEVPDLVGMDLAEAYDSMSGKPFTLEESPYEYSDTVPRGAVIRQDPLGGELAETGTSIKIVISRGKEDIKITVPNVLGLSEANARRQIENAGLVVGHVSKAESSKYAEGQVAAQTTAGGKEVYEGTSVGLVISSGPPAETPTPSPSSSPAVTPGQNPDSSPPSSPGPGESSSTIKLNPVIEEGLEEVEVLLTQETDGGEVEVYSATVKAKDFPKIVEVTGTGTVVYKLYINGEYIGSSVKYFD